MLDFSEEIKKINRGAKIVVGVDEAGRGPLAGPVVAAAVAWNGRPEEFFSCPWVGLVDDSKKISAAKREFLYKQITRSKKIIYGKAAVSRIIIDKINILEASKLAMAAAVRRLLCKIGCCSPKNACLLVDGNFSLEIEYPQESIVGGDAKVFSIAAASIVAKVARDRIMFRLHKKYPQYGFLQNKGYPTKKHLAFLKNRGLCPEHRRSFAPCAAVAKRDIINQ